MTRAYVGLGSNAGDSKAHLAAACGGLEDLPGVSLQSRSSLYASRPWGSPAGSEFLNAVVSVDTGLTAPELLKELHSLESREGRPKPGVSGRAGPRTLDADLLGFGQEVWSQPHIHVPHTALPFRTFVLVPLSEIDPFWNHPVLGQCAAELLAVLTPVYDVRWIQHPPWNEL